MLNYLDYLELNEEYFVDETGIVREKKNYSKEQNQTRDAFMYKWKQKNSYESEVVYKTVKEWLWEKYFDNDKEMFENVFADNAVVLDAGCGAGLSANALFGSRMDSIKYIGVDISCAVDEANKLFLSRGYNNYILVQGDLNNIPLKEKVDVVFSEGVLHHTDSTRKAIVNLSRHLKGGGIFCFYVYAKKAPVREFTDDYIREYFMNKSDEETWNELMALTKLGRQLGSMNLMLNIEDDIPFLGIKKGNVDLQRFFYWNICKCFYKSEYSLEEMNHINFDWFRPANCHRQTPEEVSQWCREAGLEIKRMNVEEAGITVIAQKVRRI